jgi:hypothetical protein
MCTMSSEVVEQEKGLKKGVGRIVSFFGGHGRKTCRFARKWKWEVATITTFTRRTRRRALLRSREGVYVNGVNRKRYVVLGVGRGEASSLAVSR